MARRIALVLVALAALAGTASAAATKKGDPQKRHNPTDQAWAERIRVQRADLGAGDWRVEPPSGDDLMQGGPKRCKDPDLSDLVETGSAEEPDFSRNGSLVTSGSIVFQSAAQMRTAFARLARTPFQDCLLLGVKLGASASGARVRVLSASSIKASRLAPMVRAGRVDLVVSGAAASVRGHITYHLLARGRASVVMVIASFGRPATPISPSLERHLVTIVAQRLKR
jgi:hypothetical protein